jgi:hypothetical protein
MAAIVRTNPIEVVDALAALGIPLQHLMDALLAGEIERDACTPHDPPGTPGYNSWSRCVRTLRDRFCPAPLNWGARNDNNLPMIVNQADTIAIVVATGDETTGQAGHGIPTPTTKYPVGPITIEAVEENRKQLELFPTQAPKNSGALVKTYVLLRRRIGDKLYAELSLPSTLRKDNRVEEWAERNVIEPISMQTSPTPTEETETEEIDVPVRRRK